MHPFRFSTRVALLALSFSLLGRVASADYNADFIQTVEWLVDNSDAIALVEVTGDQRKVLQVLKGGEADIQEPLRRVHPLKGYSYRRPQTKGPLRLLFVRKGSEILEEISLPARPVYISTRNPLRKLGATDVRAKAKELLAARAPQDQQLPADPTVPAPPPRTDYYFDLDDGEWPGADEFFDEPSSVQRFRIVYGPIGKDMWHPYPDEVPIEIARDLRKLSQLTELSIQSGRLTRDVLEALAELPSLKRLHLGNCRICDCDVELLAGFIELEELAFRADLHPSCFITFAKLPKLRRIQVRGYGDHFPHHVVSSDIKRAIASMDGRLEEFDAGAGDPADYGNTFGPGVARELFKVSSLKVLKFETLSFGVTLQDAEQLKSLKHLEEFGGLWAPRNSRDEDDIKQILESVEAAARQRKQEAKGAQ